MKCRHLGSASLMSALLCRAAGARAFDGLDPAERRRRAADVVSDVLSAREFQGRELDASLSTRLEQLVNAWLDRLRGVVGDLPDWVVWVIFGWMLLTLLAIVGHAVYVVYTMTGATDISRSAARPLPSNTLLEIAALDYDTVLLEATKASEAGNTDRALRYTYAAAILWLDRIERVHFRASKTNRDYLIEISGDARAAAFERMTRMFEGAAYGTSPATTALVERMGQALRELCDETTGPRAG